MEACQESSPAPTSPEALPAEDHHIDLTEDLAQQLEDIISTYQAAQSPAEPEDIEEVTAAKEPDVRKDQKLEKKMLKNLGILFFFSEFHWFWLKRVSAQSGKIQVVLTMIGV